MFSWLESRMHRRRRSGPAKPGAGNIKGNASRQAGRRKKEGKRENATQFFCGKPENSTPMVLAAAVVCGVFGNRAMVFANMAGSFFSPIA